VLLIAWLATLAMASRGEIITRIDQAFLPRAFATAGFQTYGATSLRRSPRFLRPLYAKPDTLNASTQRTRPVPNRMQLAHSLAVPDARRSSATILPFRAPRAWLDIALDGKTLAESRTLLAALLHSALGVYVTRTAERGDSIVVRLDIAPEDFDFTLHTLLGVVPQATVSALRARAVGEVR
jgi:hypothetical protein